MILIVEDCEELAQALQIIFKAHGHSTILAPDGLAALQQLQSGLRPELILLDLQMPVMTGWELLDQLKADAELSRLPVVLMSSAIGARELQEYPCLRKPFSMEDLLETVRRTVARGCEAMAAVH